MASKRAANQFGCISSAFVAQPPPGRPFALSLPTRAKCVTSTQPPYRSAQSFATVSQTPMETGILDASDRGLTVPSVIHEGLTTTVHPMAATTQSQPPNSVLATIYSFPRMEPLRFAYYPNQYLHLPLRRDILHRAVIYEGDRTRQGTASTKWRSEVHGSGRKLRPQKGTGMARIGDKKSPILRGGGVAFGPKPRDFATKLPRRVYDLAWRVALSYRYRRGELIIVHKIGNPKSTAPYWTQQVFENNGWGNLGGRSLLVAQEKDSSNRQMFKALERGGEHGELVTTADVDVKDLLSMGRVVIEFQALNQILHDHSYGLDVV